MNEHNTFCLVQESEPCLVQSESCESSFMRDNNLITIKNDIKKEEDKTYTYNSVMSQNQQKLICKQHETNSVPVLYTDSHQPYDLSYQISTMTMSSKISDCELNLVNIGKYLEIDNDIIGIKYSYGNICFSRGVYTTTNYKKSKKKEKTKINQQLFYNQISLVVYSNNYGVPISKKNVTDKQINVKLFGNGSLHITGCKSEYDGKYVTELIYHKLQMISCKTHTIILSSNPYSILLDSNNFIYKKHKLNEDECYYNIIGFYDPKTNIYVMNNKEYVVYNKIKNSFISKKYDLQKMKSICNNNGDIIGFFGYCKNKKQNIIKLMNMNYMNINEIEYSKNIYKDYNNYKIIKYKCNPFLKKDSDILYGENDIFHKYVLDNIKVNIDCINITYQLPYLINRNKLYEFFINNNYICKYNPQTYSGVKFIYKLPFYNMNLNKFDNKPNGICECNIKCICLNITFLIFRSGNIIITGFKQVKDINSVLHEFNNIMKKFSDLQ